MIRNLRMLVSYRLDHKESLITDAEGSSLPFRRVAILKGPPFWKPSFLVVAENSSWYCHNQTTDPNPKRIPNRKLSVTAENGGPSQWRHFGVAADTMLKCVLYYRICASIQTERNAKR